MNDSIERLRNSLVNANTYVDAIVVHLCSLWSMNWRMSVVHIREDSFCLAWEFDFTHVNDQHTKLRGLQLNPCTYHFCLTTVHGFIWILKVGNSLLKNTVSTNVDICINRLSTFGSFNWYVDLGAT
jgi:hypothetical protein